MSLPVGVVAAAVLLGVTHAVEPDHAAGISALTRETEGRTHAAFVGTCFAVGHVVLVVAWVALLSLLGRSAGAVPEGITAAGAVIPGILLAGVGLLLGASGLSRLRGEHRCHHHGLAAAPVPFVDRLEHDHERRGDYLTTGVVGSLFALSPPVSMLAFVAGVLPDASPLAVGGAVGAYALAITVSLAAVGAGVGTLFSLTRDRGRRLHVALELATAAVLLAVAATMLTGGH